MQKQTAAKSLRELWGMSVVALEGYKADMSLAAKRASTELEREEYRHAMERANMVINNKLGGRKNGV